MRASRDWIRARRNFKIEAVIIAWDWNKLEAFLVVCCNDGFELAESDHEGRKIAPL